MTTKNGVLNSPSAAAPPASVGRFPQDMGARVAFGQIGDIALFGGHILRDLPHLRKYSTEVIHQAGMLVLSSGLIIWVMEFVMGSECGLEASYTLRTIGAPLYSGVFDSWCAVRVMCPYMWGYIFSAKVGCGYVAEIGAMRISDEIDAMEVMGIHSRAYLVGSRLIACLIAMPFLYCVGLGVMFASEYLVTVVNLGEVSSGGYLYVFWLYQNPYDLIASFSKIMLMGIVITIVGCYCGFTARGGAVGVGKNTAKSMMINMVAVHVVGLFGTLLFWGLNTNAPIGN